MLERPLAKLCALLGRETALEGIAQDLRGGLRRLRRERSVGVAAVLTLGLTVGLATAVYSVANSILLHPFPYEHSERLLAVWKATPEVDFFPLPVPELLDVKSMEDSGSSSTSHGRAADDREGV
jgi:hypothetical protein